MGTRPPIGPQEDREKGGTGGAALSEIVRLVARLPLDVAADAGHLIFHGRVIGQDGVERHAKIFAGYRHLVARPGGAASGGLVETKQLPGVGGRLGGELLDGHAP